MHREWFAVRTKFRQEPVAKMHYERQGLAVYLPLVQTVRRHARKAEQVARPLFLGYLFLHLAPPERDWRAISSTIGSIGPVCFGDSYPPVPDWVIEGIRKRENEQGIIPLRELGRAALQPGNKVMVSLAGQDAEGIFLSFRDEERVVLLLELLHRQVRAEVPLARLKVG